MLNCNADIYIFTMLSLSRSLSLFFSCAFSVPLFFHLSFSLTFRALSPTFLLLFLPRSLFISFFPSLSFRSFTFSRVLFRCSFFPRSSFVLYFVHSPFFLCSFFFALYFSLSPSFSLSFSSLPRAPSFFLSPSLSSRSLFLFLSPFFLLFVLPHVLSLPRSLCALSSSFSLFLFFSHSPFVLSSSYSIFTPFLFSLSHYLLLTRNVSIAFSLLHSLSR